MKIEALQIQDFRGIDELLLTDFDPHLNVFVGVNGVGKSSILDALKLLLQRFQAVAMDKRAKVGFRDDDVRIGAIRSDLFIRVTLNDVACQWGTHWGDIHEHVQPSKPLLDGLDGGSSVRNQIALWRAQWKSKPPISLEPLPEAYPVLVHYPVTRAVLDIPERTKKAMEFGGWSAWDDSLTPFAAHFRTFFTWFRQQEDLENERRLELPTYRDPLLSCVRRAIEAMLPGYTDLKIRRASPVRMTMKKAGREIALQQFSDGEKCLIALVGDLARRLALSNATSQNPLASAGIVLIDELDLHLHPQWQIEVIPRLLATFTNCQFFISTHSPLLVSHVKPEQLFLLEGVQIPQDLFNVILGDGPVRIRCTRPSQNTFGQDMNMLVSTFMGTPVRERATEDRLHDIFAKLADPDSWREAGALIESARVLNPDLPDLVKAKAILARKELLAK